MNIQKFVLMHAETALEKQSSDGSFPPGHNGPMHDPETPVRNTAHWLVTFCHLYENGFSRFYEAAQKAASYLMSPKARPMNATFWCRSKPEKNFCNGVMGQAWALEGLVAAAHTLDRLDCYQVAETVFLMHPWKADLCVWRMVNVDGSYGYVDAVFNHQLWFAAIGALLTETPVARERAKKFIDKNVLHLDLYPDGVVYHSSRLGLNEGRGVNDLFDKIKYTIKGIRDLPRKSKLRERSIGYQGFNLYALAILKERFPENNFWDSKKIKKMVGVLRSSEFRNRMEKNPYGYAYNPPGIELAVAIENFENDHEHARWWLHRQADHTFNPDTGSLLSKGVPDPETADARIYEATRLRHDYIIETT